MSWTVVIIFWVIFGIICAKMAEDRGRSGLIGFFVGFLFSIFGVLIYAIIGKTEGKKAEDEAKRLKRMKEIMGDE